MRIDEIANLFPVLPTNESELFDKSPLNSSFPFSAHCQSLFSVFTSNILRKKKGNPNFSKFYDFSLLSMPFPVLSLSVSGLSNTTLCEVR